jgi:hypothetical protein|tara:strand:+ start:60 stop:299 length:240 start_codon:yes stop_codon:yes gene_type:complete
MTNEYIVLGIVMFLFVLSVKKYIDIDSLRESIEEYLSQISPLEVIEDDDLLELEEMRDMIENYVIRNPEIFSKLSVKDE